MPRLPQKKKQKQRKGKLFSLIGATALIVAIFLFFTPKAPLLIQGIIEKRLRVPVNIENIYFSPFAIKVKNFSINSPDNYTLKTAFSSEKLTIKAPLHRYFQKKIVINEIVIENVYIGLDFDSIQGAEGNWTHILENLQQSSEQSSREKVDILIKKISLKNIQTDLVYQGQDRPPREFAPIEELEFTDVTSEGGVPANQILQSVLGQTLVTIFRKENLNNMVKNVVTLPLQPLKIIISPFSALFGDDKKED